MMLNSPSYSPLWNWRFAKAQAQGAQARPLRDPSSIRRSPSSSGKIKFKAFDLGGHQIARRVWNDYYAKVKPVTGSKILRILKAHGLAPEIPEDLYHLIKKAVAIRKYLERNRKDKNSKFRLILVESRIHRLARYYKED